MPDPHVGLLDPAYPTTSLQVLVFNALFSDRTAKTGDHLLDGTTATDSPLSGDRSGWWADGAHGSRLWLLKRSKLVGDTPAQVRGYILEALDRLVRLGVLGTVGVETDWVLDGTYKIGVSAVVTVSKPAGGEAAVITYDNLWNF